MRSEVLKGVAQHCLAGAALALMAVAVLGVAGCSDSVNSGRQLGDLTADGAEYDLYSPGPDLGWGGDLPSNDDTGDGAGGEDLLEADGLAEDGGDWYEVLDLIEEEKGTWVDWQEVPGGQCGGHLISGWGNEGPSGAGRGWAWATETTKAPRPLRFGPDIAGALSAPNLPGAVAHLDPEPLRTFSLPLADGANITMPDYADDMPLLTAPFQPAEKRCYEIGERAVVLSETQAYDLYVALAEKTTGHEVDQSPGRRSVIGLRGSSDGILHWNGNEPNRFNDTLVLLWRETNGKKRVLEFPAHTDTGVNDFGWHNSSSLWPNRRYPYRCGWHKNYNALAIDIVNYEVRDDTNKNAHWDSDRNGWLTSPLGIEGEDHDRGGSAHNIHMAGVDGPFSEARVDFWSAGCQVIPGYQNWELFITNAWTKLGDPVDYFLLDVRDLDPTVLTPEVCLPDGSHQCPFYIENLPFSFQGNTTISGWNQWDKYNCSPANEGGPELVFVWRTETGGTVRAQLDDVADDAGPDIDIHLLMGDDPDACIARGDLALETWVPPGRYIFIADTYVQGTSALSGEFSLDIQLVEPE